MTPLYRTSRPHESVLPRAQSGFTREYVHGPLERDDHRLDLARVILPKLFWSLAGIGVGAASAYIFWPVIRFGLINLGAGW